MNNIKETVEIHFEDVIAFDTLNEIMKYIFCFLVTFNHLLSNSSFSS